MTEVAIENLTAEVAPPAAARPRARGIRAVAGVLALAWTAYWITHALPLLEAQSALWNGSWRPALDGYEVFEFVFVASHSGVRWMPGFALILLGAWWLERRLSRAR